MGIPEARKHVAHTWWFLESCKIFIATYTYTLKLYSYTLRTYLDLPISSYTPISYDILHILHACIYIYMGVSKNSGTPKWMVYFMENPIKMDDLGVKSPIFGNTHIHGWSFTHLFEVMPLPSLRLCSDEPAPLTALPEPTGLANRHALGGETPGGRCDGKVSKLWRNFV